MSSQGQEDWVDTLVALAARLGFNPVRVRWRLEALRRSWEIRRRRGEQRIDHVRYAHKSCPTCGRVHDRDEEICGNCGARLSGWRWHVLRRIGLSLPDVVSVSALVGVAICAAFARLVLYEGGGLQELMSFRIETLIHFGGNYAPAVWAGEWWRLGTYIFLHMGVWHLGFNLLALSQVGPAVEQLFGRDRMVLFFMATGVIAGAGRLLINGHGVSIGASGAIMGLCGVAAGWGHRDGTTVGRAARDRMLKWLLYTMVFGFFIGADNVAHAVGFISGGLIGLLARPDLMRPTQNIALRVVQGGVGGLAAVVALGLVLVPPG